MRSKLTTRTKRPLQVAAGALIFLAPSTAIALSTGLADAQTGTTPAPPLQVSLDRTVVPYGHELTVRGVAPAADRGHVLLLEFQSAGGYAWQTVASAAIHTDGSFRLRAPVLRSGSVRVVAGPAPAVAVTHAANASSAANDGGASGSSSRPAALIAPSSVHAVSSGSSLSVASGSLFALDGQAVTVSGTLLPRVAGRIVEFDARAGRGWRVLARTRTKANGHFTISYTPAGTGSEPVRVKFAGDRLSRASASGGQSMTVMRYSVASWYNDGGNTACGFHAGLGVANKTLPCGTRVTFRYGGRTVVATVDDRGPYVGGRDWDLNQNTAAALGMGGVATLESSL